MVTGSPPIRRAMAVAAGLVASLGLLVGCAAGPDDRGPDDGVLRLALSGEVPSFDPALQQSGGDLLWRWHAVFDTLLHCSKDGTVVPGAAESFDFSPDARTLTMRLRAGMTFSDGSPVTAGAAKATIERMQTGGGSDSGRVEGMTVEAPDEQTVVITAPRPTGQLPTFMCLAPGIVANPAQFEDDSISSTPMSSGPYVLDPAASTSGSVYTLRKRPDYWNADAYDYDTLVLTVMPDVMARLNALKSGQVAGGLLQQEQSGDARSAGLHILSTPASWAGLFIADRAGEQVPALGDVRVRRAINMVFDRAAIAEGMWAGEAAPTTQIFNPAATAHLPELEQRYPYDVGAARRLMAEAGYADGFEIQVPSQSGLGGTARYNPLITQQLALIGIRVVEVPLTGPTALSQILGGRFPVFWARLDNGDSLFDVTATLQPDSIWNPRDSRDPVLQKLLDRAQTARGPGAQQVFQEINAYVVDQAWFAPWVTVNSFFAVDDPALVPENTDQFHTVPNLWDFRR